ncbi:MAG: sigma-70 family RNA polymerase sigma factor [Bacteroidaceae bacterium]|nr:sigma-70 family RNA polymerase sigma factor [Bacteroidaceae bacterium]
MDIFKTLTDDSLVQLYVQGSGEAFDELLARYQDKLFSYILYNVHNEDAANDIFQETFVRAIMTLKQGRYTATGKFYSWLVRIARNQIIDQFRSAHTETPMENEETGLDMLNSVALADQPYESQLVGEQTLRDVRRLMDHLPANQREVVFMRFFQDLSFKEIAETTGVGINTALGRMRYAILNMRKMAADNNIYLSAV